MFACCDSFSVGGNAGKIYLFNMDMVFFCRCRFISTPKLKLKLKLFAQCCFSAVGL